MSARPFGLAQLVALLALAVATFLYALACAAPAPAPAAAAIALWSANPSDSIGRTTIYYAVVRYADSSMICATAAPVTTPGRWPAGCDSAAARVDSLRPVLALPSSSISTPERAP